MTNDSNIAKRGNKRLNEINCHFPMPPDVEETIRTAGAGWCDEQLFREIWEEIDRLRDASNRYKEALERICSVSLKDGVDYRETAIHQNLVATISLCEVEK